MKTLLISEKSPFENVREYIYRVIRDNILNLELPPGSSISEPDIAQQLSVSRTPVREAFIRLAEDKLLIIQPQRGTTVTLLNTGLIYESVFMRGALESTVLKAACYEFPLETLTEMEINLFTQKALLSNTFDPLRFHQLDNEFHSLIFRGCGHQFTWEFLNRFNSHHRRLRILEMHSEIYLAEIWQQHNQIFEHIKNKISDGVEELVHCHLQNFLPNLDKLREKKPEYFG